MTSTSNKLDALAKELEAVTGPQWWDTPRHRIYVLARLWQAEEDARALREELKFEKTVNDRVREVFSAWMGIKK